MIPAQFEYHAPTSVKEALQLLQAHPDAKLLAGGHSLLPMMKLRLARPADLIDLGRLSELRYIKEDRGAVVIGALTTHWLIESSALLKAKAPVLVEAAAQIGDVQVRNWGTLGGSLAHADPAADYPAAVLALEASIVAEGPKGRRTIAAAGFFTGVLATALTSQEILLEVRVPALAARTGSAYLKFPHPASGFAVVGVAAIVTLDAKGKCERARIGVTGVASTAYRANAVEAQLAGKALDAQAVAAAAEHAAEGVEANDDIFASAEYRAHLTRVYTKRAILKALERVPA
jgi:carbon-monoxide dehydrogenase medium subunit